MKLEALLDARSELTNPTSPKVPVVLTTRIRLARNLAHHTFPGFAKDAQKREVLGICLPAVAATSPMRRGVAVDLSEVGEIDRQILFERHLISREMLQPKAGGGVVVSKDQTLAVMVNEEDHLRLQAMRVGFNLRKAWNAINALDSAIEEHLDFAFSPQLGYLTACPSNVGTGMRASVMMHLPGLVQARQMDQVIRAVNQLQIVVRGLFGEGSDASGNIFQISNQATLGVSEDETLKRLGTVLNHVIEKEVEAREKLVEADPSLTALLDKIGRAYGILRQSHILSSGDAMDHLSLIRLGIDLGALPEEERATVDRLFIECQPGHVQHAAKTEADAGRRDILRAQILRREFARLPEPDFSRLHRPSEAG